jgi:hypothetical protein
MPPKSHQVADTPNPKAKPTSDLNAFCNVIDIHLSYSFASSSPALTKVVGRAVGRASCYLAQQAQQNLDFTN